MRLYTAFLSLTLAALASTPAPASEQMDKMEFHATCYVAFDWVARQTHAEGGQGCPELADRSRTHLGVSRKTSIELGYNREQFNRMVSRAVTKIKTATEAAFRAVGCMAFTDRYSEDAISDAWLEASVSTPLYARILNDTASRSRDYIHRAHFPAWRQFVSADTCWHPAFKH